jgi:anti-sigma factor RsiW
VKCQQALELLGDLVDNDLVRRDRLRLRLHLLLCRHCRRYLASYRATIRAEKAAFRGLEGPEADEEVPDDQIAAILEAVRRNSHGRGPFAHAPEEC